MFTLKTTIARNASTDPEDTAAVKFALTGLGYYDDARSGLSPYGDDKLFRAINAFQKDNNLKIDGVIKPDGPTQKTMKKRLKNNEKAGNVFGDFLKNYRDMKKTGFVDGDKYFHCKANYEATERGWGGETAAHILSKTKEVLWAPREIYRGGVFGAWNDTKQDMRANRHGREAAKSGKYRSAQDACAIYRPKGLDEKY